MTKSPSPAPDNDAEVAAILDSVRQFRVKKLSFVSLVIDEWPALIQFGEPTTGKSRHPQDGA